MNRKHCQQQAPISSQQDRRRRSKSVERGIEDQHNTPITEPVLWARRKRERRMNCKHFQHQRADNRIGNKGTKSLSEALKTNTTLQSLNLGCEQEESVQDGWIGDITNNQHQQAGNWIGAGGARALSEALKTNTSLVSLSIWQSNIEQCRKTHPPAPSHKHLWYNFTHKCLSTPCCCRNCRILLCTLKICHQSICAIFLKLCLELLIGGQSGLVLCAKTERNSVRSTKKEHNEVVFNGSEKSRQRKLERTNFTTNERGRPSCPAHRGFAWKLFR